jgi:hypothetical protein
MILSLMRILGAVLSLLVCSACEGLPHTDADKDVAEPKLRRMELAIPVCAEELRRWDVEGVYTTVLIGNDGSVRDVQVEEGAGPEGKASREYTEAVKAAGCDEEVERAVKQWRFKPAEIDGRPVAYRMRVGVTIKFANAQR